MNPAGPFETSRTDASITKLKLLLSQQASGVVIGRGGGVVTQLARQSQASMRLSKRSEVVPGTLDRVLLVQGTLVAVLSAVNHMLAHLVTHQVACPRLRLLLPNEVCGWYIGPRGDSIQHLAKASGSAVKLDPPSPFLSERILSVSGTLDQTMHALTLSLQKLSASHCYLESPLLEKLRYTPMAAGALSSAPPASASPPDEAVSIVVMCY